MPEDNSNIIYIYKKADCKGFSTKCDITLSPDMVSQDIEETCHRLTDNILKIAGEFIPTRNGRKKKPIVPWWTKECTKCTKERNRATNTAHHTGAGND